ncbi:hypothetical protein AMK59_7338 [Oryctes borbonicus]|uniref:CHK kinase-like domain-containing protein n=1 Tax=Oryctes borbonicus TaxID=1629725 RepID=A0A0T6AUC2_9SCAR|nr:hypothetical protein AMK59_7338 [Oryctes borbonicus]
MSSDKEFSVSDDAKALVNDIIERNNWDPVVDVRYSPGSQVGDGYASKHVAVEIVTSKETIRLFIKYALNTDTSSFESVAKFYANETFFYDIAYPAYSKFLTEKNVQDVFRNAPKCYGTSSKYIIALEDLKYKGFCLFDRTKIMDEKHISLMLKTLAKFHATSFAFKEQNREEYDKLVENCAGDLFSQQPKDAPTIKMFYETLADTLGKLDPEEDNSGEVCW